MTRLCARAFAVGLALAFGGPAAAQTTELTLVLPNPSALNNFPLHVAVGEGYFAEEGIEVNVEIVNGSASVLQLLASGQADIGQPGPAPLLAARARDVDVVFLYNHFAKSVFGLVVPEESEAQGPEDLRGTVIGVGTADGAEVGFVRAMMTEAGMVEGTDYEFLAVGDGGTAAAALINGEVQAYAAASSDAAIISARGFALREITPEPFFAYFGNGWAAMREFIDANPEVIEGFGRALVRGTRFGLDPANEDKVLEYTAAANPQEGEDPEFARALLHAIQERAVSADPDAPFGYHPPEAWEKWHESLQASGELSEPLEDLEAAYTNEFVEAWNEAP